MQIAAGSSETRRRGDGADLPASDSCDTRRRQLIRQRDTDTHSQEKKKKIREFRNRTAGKRPAKGNRSEARFRPRKPVSPFFSSLFSFLFSYFQFYSLYQSTNFKLNYKLSFHIQVNMQRPKYVALDASHIYLCIYYFCSF